jgi:hypothetical protein
MKLKSRIFLFAIVLFVITACTVQPEVSAEVMPTTTFTETPVVLAGTIEPLFSTIPTPKPTEEELYSGSPTISYEVQEEIKQVVEAYIDLRYQSFVALEVQNIGELISNDDIAQELLGEEIVKLTYEVKHKELNDNRYADYSVSLNYLSFTPGELTNGLEFTPLEINEIGNMVLEDSAFDEKDALVVQVLVRESSEYTYQNDVELNPDNPKVAKLSGIEHIIILKKNDGVWRIISDYYIDDLWRMIRETGITPQELLDELKDQ